MNKIRFDEEWYETKKDRVKAKLNDVKQFVGDNKKEIFIAIPTILFGIAKIMNAGARIHDQKSIARARDYKFYDNRLGTYWDLKKKLTNNERLMIDIRKRNGEYISDILSDMGVLK